MGVPEEEELSKSLKKKYIGKIRPATRFHFGTRSNCVPPRVPPSRSVIPLFINHLAFVFKFGTRRV